jgi:alpha-1,3-rhamnosyl/mannosyltransferase
MRVVVNLMSVRGRKTGVGHYAAELLRCLGTQAGNDRIDVFPPPWLGHTQDLWRRTRSILAPPPKAQVAGETQTIASDIGSIPRRALRRLGQAGQAMAAYLFRTRYCRPCYHLYHEPNFIPLPSDLPTVVTLHDLSVLLHPEWHPAARVKQFEQCFRQLLGQCVHFLVPTEFCRQEVIRVLGFPPAMVSRTHEAPRASLRWLPREQVTARLLTLGLPPQFLLHVGTIEPRKNLLLLMKAYCALPDALRISCPLVLVGGWGWNTQDLAEYFHAHARHHGVIHVGYVDDDELATIYNGALALAFPSHYEGFGLPPIEMMACGGAVLASTAGALVETVGRQAHLIDPHDLDGWRSALERVIVDADWREALRQGAVATASRFSWEACAADTLRVYRNLCGATRANLPLSRSAA